MKHIRQWLCALLALALLLPLAACGEKEPGKDPKDTTAAVSNTADPNAETTEKPDELVLDKTDFEGKALRILGTGESYGYGYYETTDIWVEEDSAEAMDSAVYRRGLACEEKYNFKIDFLQSANVQSDIESQVHAALDENDLFFESWNRVYSLAAKAMMYDLREIPTIDLSNPWWDQNANTDLSFANRLFYTAGELTTIEDKCTRYIYFNKNLLEDLNLGINPYELVKENKWTIDRFGEMAEAAANDVNGDGKVDDEDTIGFFSEGGQPLFFILGMGMKYVELDKEGFPQMIFLKNSDDYTNLEKLAKIYVEPTICPIGTYKDIHGYSNVYTYARSLFAAGRHLFTIGGALVIEEFRDMEDEFGILPMPMKDENQTRYYHIIDNSTPLFAVPSSVQETSDLGYMLEYFSYEGMKILTPVFRETLLERKYARDAESAEMLHLIFDNKAFDLGVIANWGGLRDIANSAILNGSAPKMSTFASLGKALPKLVQKDYDKLLEIGK